MTVHEGCDNARLIFRLDDDTDVAWFDVGSVTPGCTIEPPEAFYLSDN